METLACLGYDLNDVCHSSSRLCCTSLEVVLLVLRVLFCRRGSIPVSTVLRKSVRYFRITQNTAGPLYRALVVSEISHHLSCIRVCSVCTFHASSRLKQLAFTKSGYDCTIPVKPQVVHARYMRSSNCLICIFTRVCMGREIELKIAKKYR